MCSPIFGGLGVKIAQLLAVCVKHIGCFFVKRSGQEVDRSMGFLILNVVSMFIYLGQSMKQIRV